MGKKGNVNWCRQSLLKKIWRFLKTLKIELPYDALLDTCPKMKTLMQKDTYIPMFLTLFTIAKIQKQPKCPLMDEWMKKFWCTHIHKYYSPKKQVKSCQFRQCTMDLAGIMLSEVRQRKTNTI